MGLSPLPYIGRRLHFVGIGGSGMSGLALIAHELGSEVSGSDRRDGPYLANLRARGIPITVGHSPDLIRDGAELVYSSAIPQDNPERDRARALGLREIRRGELLAEIAERRRCIAVAGTHGKTTTAAMTVHALRGAGENAGYLIGGELVDTGTNADWGSSEWLVVETDESDRSLLELAPEIALLTNIELEHVRTYSSRLEVEEVFRAFLARAQKVVAWNLDASSLRLGPFGARFRWRGLDVALAVPGAHNARNATAALEACVLAGVEPPRAVAALASFRGTRRRLELIGSTTAGAAVYDDYAHHPTEIAATLAAARTLGGGRLIAVLEPHSHARSRLMAPAFGHALALADHAIVLEILQAGPRDVPAFSGRHIAQATADAAPGRPVAWLPRTDSAQAYLDATLRSGDICVAMGIGPATSALARVLVR